MASNPIDCIKLHTKYLSTDENISREAATDLALKEFEKLHGELENFKKLINPKYTKQAYVSPDKSEAIKKITDDYQKQIDEANTPISEPVKAPVTKSEGGKAESIVEGERENVREHWALSNEYRINELAEQATSEKHFKELIDKEIELESKKTPKLAQDDAESKYAVGKLTEQNQPSEELVKNIERKAESQSEADLNEVVQKADELIDTAVGVKRKKLSEINTDESRFQGRGKLNEGIVNEISKNFSDADQDPIHIWADPKDGKTYVLSGHHRYYGAKKAGRADVKVIDRTKDFTEQQAIKFAKEEANANRSMETPLERANTLREKRQRGDDKKDIAAFLDKEGKNKTFVDNLSYLNPKGKAVELLTQFERAEDKQTQKESERIADWIGEARKRNENLTNQHENEMFDYLKSEQRVTNKVEFVEKVSKASFGIRENEPLNLKKVIDKSENRIDWEDKRDELKSQVNELKSQTEKDKQTGWTGLQKDYITRLANDRFKGDADAAEKEFKKTENQEIYNKKLEDKKAELKSIQDKLAKHLLKENDLIKGDKAQQNLFEEPEPEYGKIISIDKNNPTTVEIKGEERKLPTKPAKDKQLTYTVSGFGGNGAVVTIHETPTVKGYNSGKIQHSEIFNTFNEAFEYADRLKKANVKQLYEYQSEKENKTLPATGRDITDGGRTTSLVSENNPQYGNDSPYQKALRKVREKTPQSLNETKQEPTKDIKPEQAEEKPQPEKTIVEDKQGAVGKYEEKARKIADKILKAELPDWAKADLPEGTKKAGGDFESIKKAIANATIEMGKLLDKGVEFSEAVKKAVKDIVDILGEGSRDKIEKGFAEDYKKETGFKEPPKPPVEEKKKEDSGGKLNDKGILTHLAKAKNIPEVAREGFDKEGLKYETKSQAEAEGVAKAVIEEMGIEDAVLAAEAMKFDGDVNSLIFGEALNQLKEQEDKATTPEEKLEIAKKFAEVGITYDKMARYGGRFNAAINYFYKKSPLGIVMMENAKRKDDFNDWAKPKEQSWKDFFKDFKETAEFKEAVDEKVKEQLKEERIKSRANRIAKVRSVFAKAKAQFSKGATYSTFIPPHIIETALETMELAYEAGEAVVKIVGDAVDYISQKMGNANWDKDKFRKEWEEKLKEPGSKKQLTDEELKKKLLDKFRKKLDGLNERQKGEVVVSAHRKLIEAGALDYEDFREIIAKVSGKGELTDAEAQKMKELVVKVNGVESAVNKVLEERTDKSFEELRQAQKEAGEASRELNELFYNKPDIVKRLTSIMQLSTLGAAALVANIFYNIWNQSLLRFPLGIVNSLIDFTSSKVAKLFGRNFDREYNIAAGQKEFWNKLAFGAKESGRQFLTGLNRMDYTSKEIAGQQIRPIRAWRDILGGKKMTHAQWWDKLIQGTIGIPAEAIARFLNVGDKPQRFAAEGGHAGAFAKQLGLANMDYKIFVEFPKQEAYRMFKGQGLSDEVAGEKADYIYESMLKEGQRSTFQQENLLNDVINGGVNMLSSKIGLGKDSGVGNLTKALTISPYIKIPSNAFWSMYNLLNPEIAIMQSFIHAGRSKYHSKKGENVKSKLQEREARYWMAHAMVGMAMRGLVISLVKAGVFTPGAGDDDSKKERDATSLFERAGTTNIGNMQISNRWFGQLGMMGNSIALKYKNMTPEQKEAQDDFWNIVYGGMEVEGLKELENGIFANSSSLLQSISSGNPDRYLLNTLNMFANIIQPAAVAQINKAALDEVPTYKGDSFIDKLNNSFAQRSTLYRNIFKVNIDQKRDIWGNTIPKGGNILSRMFGISKANPQLFGRVIYNDYLRTMDSGFLPPAVLPILNGDKLNTEQEAKLQEYIGNERKKLVEPYVNDMSKIIGFNKTYSELETDEKKKYVLQQLYDIGRARGVEKFYSDYKKLRPRDKPIDYQFEIEKGIFNDLIKLK